MEISKMNKSDAALLWSAIDFYAFACSFTYFYKMIGTYDKKYEHFSKNLIEDYKKTLIKFNYDVSKLDEYVEQYWHIMILTNESKEKMNLPAKPLCFIEKTTNECCIDDQTVDECCVCKEEGIFPNSLTCCWVCKRCLCHDCIEKDKKKIAIGKDTISHGWYVADDSYENVFCNECFT